jgi:small subunit ribosomal protein S13
MLYILGAHIPNNKSLKIALNSIHGIGNKTSLKSCHKLNIIPHVYVYQLTDFQINKLKKEIRNYIIGLNLKNKIKNRVKTLIYIGCYRGFRHNLGLPVRGQRTHTNAKTQKKLAHRFFLKKKVSNPVVQKKNQKIIKKK